MATIRDKLILKKGESLVLVEIDFSERHELETGGETIDALPTLTVMKDGSVSTNLTISDITLDPTFKIVQFKVTVESGAVVRDTYEISCPVLLSGGATIKECLFVRIYPC